MYPGLAPRLSDRSRELRRLLWRHLEIEEGCSCGARRPRSRSGIAWHLEHLAMTIASGER